MADVQVVVASKAAVVVLTGVDMAAQVVLVADLRRVLNHLVGKSQYLIVECNG